MRQSNWHSAPCGHKGAECVIGNYWACSVCDGLARLREGTEGTAPRFVVGDRVLISKPSEVWPFSFSTYAARFAGRIGEVAGASPIAGVWLVRFRLGSAQAEHHIHEGYLCKVTH